MHYWYEVCLAERSGASMFFHFCGAGSSPVSAIEFFPFIFYFANVAKTPLRVNSSTNKNQNLVEVKKYILLLPGLEPAPYKSEKNRRP